MLKTSFLILTLFGFVFMFSFVFAQEAAPLKSPSQNASPTPVEYSLPYPGILPDHPLFFIKVLRDRILQIFISNPIKKCEFQILLADKYLNSGYMLLEKNKQDMAIKSFSNSVDSLTKAESYLFEIPAGDRNLVANVKDRFEKSLQKHQEILIKNSDKFSESQNQQIKTLLDSLTSLSEKYQNKK